MKNPFLLTIILLFTISACSGLTIFTKTVEIKEEIIECYPDTRPDWMDKMTQSNDNFEYFVGHSVRKSQERDARDDAMVNAINQLVRYCGVEVKTIDEYLITTQDKSSKIVDPTVSSKEKNHQLAEAFIRHIRGIEWYNCKTKYSDNKTITTGWLSSVLIAIPKEEIEKIKQYDQEIKEEKKLESKKLLENKILEEENKKQLIKDEQKISEEKQFKEKQIEKEKIRIKIKTVSDIYNTAQEQEKKGEILSSFEMLDKASEMLAGISNEIYLSEILKEEKLEAQLTLSNIDFFKEKIKKNIIIQKISGDRQIVKKGERILNPLIIELKYNNGESNIPIKNVPITISIPGKFGKIEDIYTDADGKAVYNAFAVSTDDESYSSIDAILKYKNENIKSVRFIIITEKSKNESFSLDSTKIQVNKTEILNSIDQLFYKIRQEKPEFKVEVWTDKKEYYIGELIKFHIKASRDCYVTLIDIATSGIVYILFPNKYSQNNFIQADKNYYIPGEDYGFKMKVSNPPGIEKVKVIAAINPISIFDMNFNNSFFEIDVKSNATAKEIEILPEKLNKTIWTETIYEFQIFKNEIPDEKGLKEEEGTKAPKPIPIGGTDEVWDSTGNK